MTAIDNSMIVVDSVPYTYLIHHDHGKHTLRKRRKI